VDENNRNNRSGRAPHHTSTSRAFKAFKALKIYTNTTPPLRTAPTAATTPCQATVSRILQLPTPPSLHVSRTTPHSTILRVSHKLSLALCLPRRNNKHNSQQWDSRTMSTSVLRASTSARTAKRISRITRTSSVGYLPLPLPRAPPDHVSETLFQAD